jgi:exodeoxyribonuclease VII large subunit
LLDRASASNEAMLKLHFRDGVLDVIPADGPVSPPGRNPPSAPRAKPKASEPRQSSLF